MAKTCRLINLSFDTDCLSYLASEICKYNDSQQLILLPSQRAVRNLKLAISKQSSRTKFNNSINIISYSNIPYKLSLFDPCCNNLNFDLPKVLDPFSLEMIILELVEELRKRYLTFAAFYDLKIESYLKKFIIKFFNYNDDLPNTVKNNPEYEIFNYIIESFKQKLIALNKVTEQQLRNIAVQRLKNSWIENNNSLKIFALLPPTNTPYILDFLKLISTTANNEIIIQGLTKSDITNWESFNDKTSKFFIKHFITYIGKTCGNIEFKSSSLDSPPKKINLIEANNIINEASQICSLIASEIKLHDLSIGIITENRTIAKLIKEGLKIYNITPDDTVATTFLELNESKLLILILKTISLYPLDKVTLLSLLKYPLINIEREQVESFEINILRTPKQYKSLKEFAKFLENHEGYAEVLHILKSLVNFQNETSKNLQFIDFLSLHLDYFKQIVNLPDFQATEFLNSFKNNLENSLFSSKRVNLKQYQTLLMRILGREPIRDEEFTANIKIITMLEARAQKFDLVIIPDSNEGSIPNISKDWPIIDNTLATQLNFPHYNEIIGIASYDFESIILGNKDVVLSRSTNVLGKEALESRFLLELRTKYNIRNQTYPTFQDTIQVANLNYTRANPKLPIEARPLKLSVSAIERLMHNPYVYYARDILKLIPLEELDSTFSKKHFGICLHAVLKTSLKSIYNLRCEEFTDHLVMKFRTYAKINYGVEDLILDIWTNRIIKIAPWLYNYEQELSSDYQECYSEQKKFTTIRVKEKEITLYAIFDRVIILKDNKIKIIDYKTGYVPSQKEVDQGLSPQFPVENLILEKIFTNHNITQEYLELKGKKEVAKIKSIKIDTNYVQNELEKLIAHFLDENIGYFAITDLERHQRFKEYHHLISLIL